jgi:hypothetical protein
LVSCFFARIVRVVLMVHQDEQQTGVQTYP